LLNVHYVVHLPFGKPVRDVQEGSAYRRLHLSGDDEAILVHLRQLRVDFAQGFAIPPVPVATLLVV